MIVQPVVELMDSFTALVGLHEVLVVVLSTAEAADRLLHTLAAAPPQPAPGPTPSVLDNARTARGSITQYCATLLCFLYKVRTEKFRCKLFHSFTDSHPVSTDITPAG